MSENNKEFLIIENGTYIKYLRHGECNQCGKCCCANEIGVLLNAGEGNLGEGKHCDLSDYEGWSHHRDQKVDWWWRLVVKDEMLEVPCPDFDDDGKCKSWKDDNFPAVCRYFPMHPRDIERFPECGFRFERIGPTDQATDQTEDQTS